MCTLRLHQLFLHAFMCDLLCSQAWQAVLIRLAHALMMCKAQHHVFFWDALGLQGGKERAAGPKPASPTSPTAALPAHMVSAAYNSSVSGGCRGFVSPGATVPHKVLFISHPHPSQNGNMLWPHHIPTFISMA